MLLKVNGQYLEFNGDIEHERQVKLFEQIDTTQVDFSYSFNIPKTDYNLGILGSPRPDVSSKRIYANTQCDVLNNSGDTIYKGLLRVDRINTVIECSFFSGNYNWISQITGNMTELRLNQYDVSQTEANIIASWSNTSGIIFPFLDTGSLLTRGYQNAIVEDFVGAFYLKTLFKEIFTQSGFKLKGDFMNDWVFNNAIILTNTRSKTDKENNSAFLGKTSTQNIPNSTTADVTFNNTSSPYSVGSDLTFTSSTTITVPYKMIADINAYIESTSNGLLMFIADQDDVTLASDLSSLRGTASARDVLLEAGTELRVYVINGTGSSYDITFASFRITAKYVYHAFGRSCVPLWTKQEFVGRVLNIFNAITDYNPYTKTLTIDLFDKIKTKTPIDISEYVTIIEEDYSDFISNYGRSNKFSYKENDDDSLKEYNISSFMKYGAGAIEIDNDFVPESADVIASEFAAPVSYLNPTFDCSLERVQYTEIDELDEQDFASVTDSAGIPRFNITDADDFFADGDFVRITDSTEISYNGDYIVSAVTSTYITVLGLDFVANATGKVIKLQQVVSTDENVYMLINTGEKSFDDFSNFTGAYLESTFYNDWNFSYFNVLNLGHPIEDSYKQGLSFGGNETSSFQRTLLQTYWRNFGSILSDPVKLKAIAHFPKSVFLSLTPLTPVYIKTKKTTNLYYINRITGYKESHLPCEVELIKL